MDDADDHRLLTKLYSAISSFQYLGQNLIFSFVQLYADHIGATASEQGLLLSSRNIISFSGQQLFGNGSDRLGRSIVLLFGFVLSAISSFLILQSYSPLILIMVFILYSIGFSAVQPSFNALIGDTYQQSQRAEKLGKITSTGSFIGSISFLCAGLIADILDNSYVFLFIVATVSFGSAGIIVIIINRLNRIPVQPVFINRKNSFLEPFKIIYFKKFVLMDALFAFAMSTSWPLFPKRTNELATTSQVSIMWAITFIGFSITARYTSKLKDYFDSYPKSFYYSRFLLWLVPVSFAFATEWYHLIPARIIAGLTFGYYSTLQKEFILDTVQKIGRPDSRGLFLGTHAFFFGISTFIGSLFFGYLVDYIINFGKIGYTELFLISALLRLILSHGYLLIPNIKT